MREQLTIADIAEALGVSKTTVSRAISGKGRIGSDTREKVMSFIKEHDYKPNAVAQGLAKSKTYNIGVVMPGEYILVDMPFFLDCLEGLYQIASKSGYDIIWTMCNNNDMTDLERIIHNHKIDGVVLMRTYVEDHAIELLQKYQVPFITIGSTTYENVIQIDQDHAGGCKELTSILLMKGLKKIALIGGSEEHVVSQTRYQGFREAFLEMKIPIRTELIYQNQENSIMIENVVGKLLKQHVDCIICMDDNICESVLKALCREAVAVPEQVKVASFFNSSMLENYSPTITSLDFDTKELGMVACQTMIDLIRGKEVQPKRLLQYNLVLKESTK